MADMNTLITAFENARKAGDEAAATRLAQAIKSMQQQQQGSQDGAFSYGVDKAQQMAGKGIEVIGDLVGSESVKDFGSGIVAQQEKDIKAGGYQPKYSGSLTDNYKDGGLDAALGWLVEKTAENAASGGVALVGTGLSAAIAVFSAPAALVVGGGTLVASGVMGAGETAMEMEDKTGTYDPKVAAGVGVLVGILDKFGAGKVIPTDKLASMTGKELVGELMDKGFVDAAQAVGGRITKSTIAEGATETAQEGAIMAGTAATGGSYTGGEIVDRSIDAFALGGTLGGGTSAAIETGKGVAKAGKATTRIFAPGETSPTDPEAAADLAQRLNGIAEANGYDLNDIDKTSTSGARETVDKAHVQLAEELKQVATDLKQRLGITDTDELSVVLNKVMAAAGQREARNKTKNTVGKQEMDAVESLTGDTAEGQRMMSIMRQLNELTEIHNGGYQGGLSKITDQFAPFGTNIGYDRGAIATERLLRPLVSGGAALQTGGTSLIGQAAVAGAGRAIDAMTGRRSRVRRYIEQNKNEQGIEQGSQPSLRQAAIDERNQQELANQQEAARKDELRKDMLRRGDPPKGSPQDPNPSPEYIMQSETGLDRKGISRVLNIIEGKRKQLVPAVKSYRRMLSKGTEVKDLNELIAAAKREADLNPELFPERQAAVQNVVQGQAIESPGYLRGIEANKQAIRDLKTQVQNDASINRVDKQIAMQALDEMGGNLGSNPVQNATAIMSNSLDKAKQPETIEPYLQSYVDRVVRQQPKQQIDQMAMFDLADADQYDTSTTFYHGTPYGFAEFDKGAIGSNVGDSKDAFWFSDSPETSEAYAKRTALEDTPNIIPVYLPKSRTKTLLKYDVGDETFVGGLGQNVTSSKELEAFFNGAAESTRSDLAVIDMDGATYSYFDTEEWETRQELRPNFNDNEVMEKAINAARDAGFKGIVIKNYGDSAPLFMDSVDAEKFEHDIATHVAIFDPDIIRSKFAPQQPDVSQQPALSISQKTDFEPALSTPDVFDIGSDIDTTILPIYPSEGSKPAGDVTMSLNEAVQWLHDRWVKSTGQTEPFEYTPENIDRISKMMAAEAERALQDDSNAIGWYDRKLKAAKSVLSIVEPRIFDSVDNEAAFDLALAVTSNGAAVTDNFANAVEVFRDFLNTGKMPADTWKKGGERNESMVKAFNFYNAYQAARLNTPFQDFMDQDFTVRELLDVMQRFNEANGTDIQLSVSENMDAIVKGSFVLGAKIGQGFYQNIRGNYDPLTMDIWWMRMWNRLAGRPFAESKESDMQKNRDKVASIVKEAFKPKSELVVEKKLIKEALAKIGENRKGLYTNPERMDAFITALDSRWQSYFKRYQKENNKKNPVKPQLFKTTGTHTKNIKGKLQATPAGGTERAVMREATGKAIELLRGIGYDIATADFQALMWYPEKRLFRSLGVKGGRGEDNDYLDAATILANKEGISDDKIKETLANSEQRDGIDSGSNTRGQDGILRQRTGSLDGTQAGSDSIERQRQLSLDFNGQSGTTDQGRDSLSQIAGSRPADPAEIRDAKAITDPVFDIGKPGSQFENGIKDVETAKKLATALGAALHIAPTKSGLAKLFGQKSLGTGFTTGAAQSNPDPREKVTDRTTGEKVTTVIGVLDVYQNPKNRDEKQTALSLIWASMHELGHVLESRFVPGKTTTKRSPKYSQASDGKTVSDRSIYENTFRQAIASVMDAAAGMNVKGMTEQDARDILDEIIRFQRKGVLTFTGEEITSRPTFPMYQREINVRTIMGDDMGARRLELELMGMEDNYFQKPHELAADLFGFYLFDPQAAKKQMPKATKLVRDVMNKGDGTVKFFSMPFAALVAAIFANMMVADGEEEEKRGLLTLGQGALSA